jgi:hypothetical protein
MAANNALIVTDINFDTIKANLQAYLSSQSEFQDYDFESSGMQTIIQLLAYNTYYNSIYTNFASNESFLDTALIRNNVVSRAKMLGFTPNSARGARATLNVTVNPAGTPSTVIVPANTQFTSTVDGVSYIFQSINSTTFTRSDAGAYTSTMVIREGDPVQESYTVSTVNPVRYLLNNENADTTSLRVRVQESVSNTAVTVYTLADDISTVKGTSAVYFLQENNEGSFEVLFGDNIVGKKPSDGNIVRLNYNVCNGPTLNGARTFNGPATLAGNSSYTITTSSRASGGANPQSIDSIKFNAPRNYSAQNRAVTANDYKNILLNNAPDLQTISVWGGEKNSPPVYGKVYIAAKPIGSALLTQTRKDELVELLDSRNVLTIEPVFVDAEYLYIVPTVTVRYNPNVTNKTGDTLLTQVNSVMSSFNTNELGVFNRNFYLSEFIKKIDAIDDSVINVSVTSLMQRRFIPNTTITQAYQVKFNNPIYNPHSGHKYAISSSSFTYQGFTCYFDDDGSGKLRIYRIASGARVYVTQNAGTINYQLGSVKINAIKFTAYSGDGIKINAVPRDQVVKSVRSQIVQLADATVSIVNNNTDASEAFSRSLTSTNQTTVSTETGVVSVSSTY